MSELLRLLREYDVGSTFSRPDSSGVRKGWTGVVVKTQGKGNEFPYDEPADDGEPAGRDDPAFDLGGKSHHGITPKDISHSAWELEADDIKEVMGSPMLIGKSGDGGSSVNGSSGATPGANGGWADSPAKPWEEEEDTPDYAAYGHDVYEDRGYPVPMEPEAVDNEDPEKLHDQTDEEEENKLNRIWGQESDDGTERAMMGVPSMEPDEDERTFVIPDDNMPSSILVVGTPDPFTTGLGASGKGQRNLYGLGWKENADRALEVPERSAWEEVVELADPTKEKKKGKE